MEKTYFYTLVHDNVCISKDKHTLPANAFFFKFPAFFLGIIIHQIPIIESYIILTTKTKFRYKFPSPCYNHPKAVQYELFHINHRNKLNSNNLNIHFEPKQNQGNNEGMIKDLGT